MTCAKHFYCRGFKNYQSTFNGLQDVKCKKTCRDCIMRILNATNNISLGLFSALTISRQV
jgi:hypothetical protein